MLKVERSLMWTHIQIVGADHKLASGIASALGLTMQEDAAMEQYLQAGQFRYDLLDSKDEYCGSFDTNLHKISFYIDFNSDQFLKYSALGGESWLQSLLEKSVDKSHKN